MKNLYCPNCGAGNQYEFKKPNFCTSCGNKFAHASLISSATQPKKVQIQQVQEDDEEIEEEFENISFNNIKPLDFSLDIGVPQPYTIKSLSTLRDPLIEKSNRKPASKREMKKMLSDLQSKVKETRNVDLG